MIIEVTGYDLETNGLRNTSVLSFTQMSYLYDSENSKFNPLSSTTRWYARREGEKMNFDALRVNRLYDNVIERNRKRANARYPLYFEEDLESLLQFFSRDCVLGHNHIAFDNSFMGDGFIGSPAMIDTMVINRDIIRIPSRSARGLYKNPKLIEAAEFYNVNTMDKDFHTSEDDVIMTVDIFKKMLSHPEALPAVENEIKNVTTARNSRQIKLTKDIISKDLGGGVIYHSGKDVKGIEQERKFFWNTDGNSMFSSKDLASHIFGLHRFTKEITSDFSRYCYNIETGKSLTAYLDRININYQSIPENYNGTISYNSKEVFAYDESRKYFYDFMKIRFPLAKIKDLSIK